MGPIAGIGFVVLFVLGFLLASTPSGDDPDAKWLSYWHDSGHRTSGILASLAVLLSAMMFLWLLGAIKRRLPVGAIGADAAYAGGIAYGTVLLVAGFGRGIIPVGYTLADIPLPQNADLVRLVDGMFFGVVFLALPYAAAALLIPLFVALDGAGLVPSWLRWATLVVGIVCLSGPFLFVIPHLLFLLWALAVSITLLARRGRPTVTGGASA